MKAHHLVKLIFHFTPLKKKKTDGSVHYSFLFIFCETLCISKDIKEIIPPFPSLLFVYLSGLPTHDIPRYMPNFLFFKLSDVFFQYLASTCISTPNTFLLKLESDFVCATTRNFVVRFYHAASVLHTPASRGRYVTTHEML